MTRLDNLNQNVLGCVALIVSLVALLTTVLQVLQQYFSSAEGYRRCHKSVMGKWAEGTHRRLRIREFRFEVVFETPVIFTARPDNVRGPIPGKKIHYLNGSPESYKNTRVLAPEAQQKAEKKIEFADASARVHTADDERASWVTLLSALQQKEKISREWDIASRTRDIASQPPPPRAIESPEYDIEVGLQSKTRSWDFISSSITKPYATSAICHLVEIMAMLGIYWKAFDQTIWNLRAEGNGFILTSTTVHGLGLMVTFAVTGKSQFQKTRVIPTIKIKELAFGTVPNIFEEDPRTETQSLELVFGTDDDVTNTLEYIGCQADTLERYKKDHKHIFSISFEIIGMLGQVFRIRGSNFRMLPNPTSDSWPKQKGTKASWKIARLMELFQEKLQKLKGFEDNHVFTTISKKWREISALGCKDEGMLKIDAREAIHDSIDSITDGLLRLTQAEVLKLVVSHVSTVLQVLANPVSPLNTIILANQEEALMNYYFDIIRPCVVENKDPPGVVGNVDPVTKKTPERKPFSKNEQEERNELWISLVFRMLCWLLLHEFDKMDTKIVPSDLKGSRMPVYIG